MTKKRKVCSSVSRLVESTCIQASPWAELIYVAAQGSKPRVCTYTILLGAVWLEMGEKNLALTHPAIWFSLHTCTVHAHTQNTLTPSHMHAQMQIQTCAFSGVFLVYLRQTSRWRGATVEESNRVKNNTTRLIDIYWDFRYGCTNSVYPTTPNSTKV